MKYCRGKVHLDPALSVWDPTPTLESRLKEVHDRKKVMSTSGEKSCNLRLETPYT